MRHGTDTYSLTFAALCLALAASTAQARPPDLAIEVPLLGPDVVLAARATMLADSAIIRAPVGAWLAENTKGTKTVPVFFYGSYMVPAFIEQRLTIAAARSLRPAIAYGALRVFDFTIPASRPTGAVTSSGGPTLDLTGRPADFVNGTLIDLTAADVARIAGPENVFDLVPILVTAWPKDTSDRVVPFKAFALVAPGKLRNAALEPHAEYWCAIDKGVQPFGSSFHRMWRDTTWRGGLVERISVKPPNCD